LTGYTDILSSKFSFRPQWSPDGRWIVYDDHERTSSYDTNPYKIYRMHPDGSAVECLTCNRPEVPLNSGGAQFDPSGRYLVFSAEQAQHYTLPAKSTAADPGGGIFNDLAILDFKTKKITRLNVVASGLRGQYAGGTLFPRFSHSGTRIAWGEYVNKGVAASRFGAWRIVVADFIAIPEPHLENRKTYTPGPRPGIYEIQGWMTDDSSLLISCAPLPGQDDNALDIAQMNLATGQLKQLTFTAGVQGQPAEYEEHAEISPGGDALAFMSSAGYGIDTKRFFITWLKTELWLANADGSQPRQLTSFNVPGKPGYNGQRAVVSMLSWAPDASAIVANVYYFPDLFHHGATPSHIVVFHFGKTAAASKVPDATRDPSSHAAGATSLSGHQYRVMELSFSAASAHPRPLADVGFTGIFEGPGGERFEVPGFWDGGRNWKIRFAPPSRGNRSYRTICNHPEDSGLQGQSGRLSVLPAAGDNPLYRHGGILKISPDKHYLTYSDGSPFFWLGDTWWTAPSDSLCPIDRSTNPRDPNGSMFKTLIDTRRKQGYSVVQWTFGGDFDDMRTSLFFHPREWKDEQMKAWRKVDQYFRYANDAGIFPFIGSYWSFNYFALGVNLEDLKLQWKYIVSRYGAFATSWLVGGEYNQEPPIAEGLEERLRTAFALGAYIKAVDPYHRTMSIHPRGSWADKRQVWNQPWYDFIMLQGGHAHGRLTPKASLYLNAYHSTPRRPVLEAECRYEGIWDTNDADVRQAAYRAIQSGAFGYTYGAQGLYHAIAMAPPPPYISPKFGAAIKWWEALALPGGAQMQYLRRCYESVDWWKLEPRPEAVSTTTPLDEPQRILTKADADLTFLVYFPRGLDPRLPATLGGGNPSRTYVVTWFDPRTGETSIVDEQLRMPQGRYALPYRRDNRDWMLIVKSTLERE
jgi:Tol biopolymer transport system component